MNNNIGRFNGADAIQRMKAQQANAPQVGQEQETSQTVKKPLSKSEVASMIKGKGKDLGELVNNKDSLVGEAQEVHVADGEGSNTANSCTQKALKDMGFTDYEIEQWFTKDGNDKYTMRDDIEYKYGHPRHQETGTIKTLDELKERMGINIRNQKIAETGYPAELFEAGFRPVMDLWNGKVVDFVLKEGVQLDDQMYGENRVLTLTNENSSKNIYIVKPDGSTYEVKLDECWAYQMGNITSQVIYDELAIQEVANHDAVTQAFDPLAEYEGVTEITDVQVLYDIGFNEEEIGEYFDKVESENGTKYVMKNNIGFPAGRTDGTPYVYGEKDNPLTELMAIAEDLKQLIKLTGVNYRKNILKHFPEGMFNDCYTLCVKSGNAYYASNYGYNKVTTAHDGKQIVTFYSPLNNQVNGIAIYNPEDGTYEWIIEPREQASIDY